MNESLLLPSTFCNGFYVAPDQGFYADAELDVETLPSGPEHPLFGSRGLPFASIHIGSMKTACLFSPNSINSSKIYVFLGTGRRMHAEILPLTHPPHLLLQPKIRNLKIDLECVHFGDGHSRAEKRRKGALLSLKLPSSQDRNKILQKKNTLIPEHPQNLLASHELHHTRDLGAHKIDPFFSLKIK